MNGLFIFSILCLIASAALCMYAIDAIERRLP